MSTPLFPTARQLTAAVGLFAATVGLSAPAPTGAAPAAPDPSPKTHTLYLGADFAVERDRTVYRVLDVEGGSFVILVNGQNEKVPMDRGPVNLKIDQALKLTDRAVVVDGLRYDRSYTAAADPRRKWTAVQAGGLAEAAGVAGAKLTDGLPSAPDAGANPFLTSTAPGAVPPIPAAPNHNQAPSEYGDPGSANAFYQSKIDEELRLKLFDAVEIDFAVSAPEALVRPYVVVVAQYRDNDKSTAPSRNWIYARALDSVGPSVRKVHFQQGGFPPGFVLEKLVLHLYDDGREMASNVAERRVPLTRNEAFQYLLAQHLHQVKAANTRASVALGSLGAALRQAGRDPALLGTLYVQVKADGRAAGVFLDEECTKPADPQITALAQEQLRFYPRLEKGRAIDDVAPLRLGSPGR